MITRETLMLKVMVGYSTLQTAPVAGMLPGMIERMVETWPGVCRCVAEVTLSKLEGEQAHDLKSELNGFTLARLGDGPWQIFHAENEVPWPPYFPDRAQMQYHQAEGLARALGMDLQVAPNDR